MVEIIKMDYDLGKSFKGLNYRNEPNCVIGCDTCEIMLKFEPSDIIYGLTAKVKCPRCNKRIQLHRLYTKLRNDRKNGDK